MNNKILSTLNIGNNSYEIDDAFARQKIEEVDNNLLKINPVYSTSGSVVSFDDGADNLPLDELIVDINPVQDLHGYDHPWIGGGGKNLFDKEKPLVEGKYISNDGSIQNMSGYEYSDYYTPVEANTTYIFSCTYFGSGYNTISFYDENKTFLGRLVPPTSQTGASFTTPQDCAYIRFNMGRETILSTLQLEKGSVATDYEPYENICPITGWTGMNIQRCGKNVLRLPTYEEIIASPMYNSYKNFKIRVKPDTDYYLSTVYLNDYSDKTCLALISPTVGNASWRSIAHTSQGAKNGVVHSTADGVLYLNTYSVSQTTWENLTSNVLVQLEEGTTATDYEPYNGIEIPISWESEAGTIYGGNLNVLTGVLTVTDELITIDGATHKMNNKWGETSYGAALYTQNIGEKGRYSNSISNIFKRVTSSYTVMPLYSFVGNSGVDSTITFIFPSGMTVDDANTWLAEMNNNGSPIIVTRTLETPITYQLTPHEVKTFLDQNNIFTNINSKNILVSYKADIQKCIDNKLNIDETAHRTTSILYGQVDATSTSTKFTATIDGITEYFDGLTILLKNGVVASASGFTIDINGLGGKSVFSSLNITSKETTAFTTTSVLTLIYDSTLDNGNGGWIWYKGQDKDTNTIGYAIRTNSKSLPLSSILYRYRLLFTSADRTHYIPANNSNSTNTTSICDVCQEKIDPFGDIVYYGTTTTIQPENRPSPSTLWLQNALSLGYSFNRTGQALTLELWKPVYVKATPYVDGSAIIDADEPYVQDLPITDDGKIYIYLGVAYNTASVELSLHHPIYYCYNGVIRPWLGFTDSEHAQDIVSSVNGKTGTVTLTAEDIGAMEGMTILSYGHSTWAEFLEAYEANRIVYCKASINSNPSTGQQGRMAFLAYVQYQRQGYSDKAEFQYYRSVSTHTDAQQGDQVFCYSLSPINGGTWSVETRQASSRVVAGTGLSSAYTTDKVTLSLDADYKSKIDTLWTDYQSRIGQ